MIAEKKNPLGAWFALLIYHDAVLHLTANPWPQLKLFILAITHPGWRTSMCVPLSSNILQFLGATWGWTFCQEAQLASGNKPPKRSPRGLTSPICCVHTCGFYPDSTVPGTYFLLDMVKQEIYTARTSAVHTPDNATIQRSLIKFLTS